MGHEGGDALTTLFIASVGGSRAPIISALAARRPDFALFVVTRREGSQPGSAEEVPPILEAAQLSAMPHQLLTVPADDPEAAFLALRETLRQLRERYPKARLVFDYTGGTKSMTSALFQCALATPAAELQFMAGRRENLDRVTSGTERPTPIPIAWLIAERTEARLRVYWRDFAYAECAAGARTLLADIETDEKSPPAAKQRLRDLADAAEAFDLWDRFRHADAAQILARVVARHPDLAPFSDLAGRCRDSEAQRLVDLWRNAERCAKRGRYDDAVARCYRLIEWVGQWRLRSQYRIEVDDIDWSRITDQEVIRAGIADRQSSNAKTLSGLVQTLKLAAAKEPEGAIDRFLRDPYPGTYSGKRGKDGERRLRDMIDLRNKSILAHGATPLGLEDWQRFAEFMGHFRSRVVVPLLRAVNAATDPPQLPDTPPDTF